MLFIIMPTFYKSFCLNFIITFISFFSKGYFYDIITAMRLLYLYGQAYKRLLWPVIPICSADMFSQPQLDYIISCGQVYNLCPSLQGVVYPSLCFFDILLCRLPKDNCTSMCSVKDGITPKNIYLLVKCNNKMFCDTCLNVFGRYSE